MMSKPLAIAGLVLGCLAAAAAGGYFAARESGTVGGSPDPASQLVASPAAASTAQTTAPVRESEALVEPARPDAPGSSAAPDIKSTESKHPAVGANASREGRTKPTASRVVRPGAGGSTREAMAASPSASGAAAGNTDQSWKGIDRPWPSGSAAAGDAPQPQASTPATAVAETTPVPPVDTSPPSPPAKVYEELVVPSDSVIGLQLDTPLSSERARLEDRVESRVTRDVRVGERVAIPAGSQILGSVTQVERGGKFKERARLGIKFHTLVLADGTRVPLTTEAIYREGAGPGKESAAKIGGAAVGGAILGAILGGGKGAAIGGATGAAGGAAAVAASDRNAVTLPAGTNLTVRILSPVTVEVER
ncbi:MAG: hypothetical protein HYS05_04375 [Acidobacteria bacterium]|nr:hypothetical protein [Acidobacteriota bacterium]